jgi:uncharacterized protein (TIGR04255 family)
VAEPYSRAPIIEAVIDLRAAFDKQPTLDDVKAFAEGMKPRYPLVHDINSFAVNFAAEAGGAVSTKATSEQLGFRLSRETNDRVVQLGTHGFSFSHMPPYSDWNTFRDEAVSLWDGFVAEFHVRSVTRIALRYINRISIPVEREIEDFVNIGPRIPESISRAFIGYFTQMVLPLAELGPEYRAIINTGIEPPTDPALPAFLLDIDTFGERSYSLDEIIPTLERLRVRKNEIFEASITDCVRESIR